MCLELSLVASSFFVLLLYHRCVKFSFNKVSSEEKLYKKYNLCNLKIMKK